MEVGWRWDGGGMEVGWRWDEGGISEWDLRVGSQVGSQVGPQMEAQGQRCGIMSRAEAIWPNLARCRDVEIPTKRSRRIRAGPHRVCSAQSTTTRIPIPSLSQLWPHRPNMNAT